MNPLLDEREAARLLNKKVKTLQRWRFDRRGPAYVKVGRNIRYRIEDVLAFVHANRIDPGAQVEE